MGVSERKNLGIERASNLMAQVSQGTVWITMRMRSQLKTTLKADHSFNILDWIKGRMQGNETRQEPLVVYLLGKPSDRRQRQGQSKGMIKRKATKTLCVPD